MPVTVTEPLLISEAQLAAAIAIIEEEARSRGIEMTIDAGMYVDPEYATEPAIELLTVTILREPPGGQSEVRPFLRATRARLRDARMSEEFIPLAIYPRLAW